MTTYAIGDVQGCYRTLRALLDQIRFRSASDTLWLAGDLVNRGPRSADVLRFLQDLPHAVAVLGNHDIHLLSLAAGCAEVRPRDTCQEVLEAADAASLLGWLKQQPFFHYDPILDCALVHAGVIPLWNQETACQHAANLSLYLQSEKTSSLLLAQARAYSKCEVLPDAEAADSLAWNRFCLYVFTRLRYCSQEGTLHMEAKYRESPEGFFPWFDAPHRQTAGHRIAFGHWSTLMGETGRADAIALDTGAVWGQHLTAWCVETGQYWQAPFQG